MSSVFLSRPTGPGLAWEIKTANFDAVAGGRYICNTTGGIFTATLPASPSATDAPIYFSDGFQQWNTNNLTVGRNGLKIAGTTEDLTCATKNACFGLQYSGATNGWVVIL